MPSLFWALTLGAQAAVTPLVVLWARHRAGLSRGWTAALMATLVTWFALAVLASQAGVFLGAPDRLPVMGLVIVATITGGQIALLLAGARVPERALATLTALQIVRLTGFEFVPAYRLGLLPAHFSLPAGLGDAFIGVTAPLMALVVARRVPGWRRLALAWNLLGITDLVVAAVMGVFSAPGPQRVFMAEPSTAWLLRLPLSLIPAFGVPLAMLGHVLALDGLRRCAAPRDVRGSGASLTARTTVAVALLALLSATGCAAPLACPAKGGAPWTEATSAHFVLRTDVELHEALAMLSRFESLWTVLAYVTMRPSVTEPKIDIVRFERHRDMVEITGHAQNTVGYFTQALPGDFLEPQPTVVFHGLDLADEDRETFLHELTHRFLRERFAAMPTWLNEGLAQYYATLRIDAGRVVLGETGGLDFSDRTYWWSSWRGNAETVQVPAFKAPKVVDLVNADSSTFHSVRRGARPTGDDEEREAANYAAAWKLVHYFLDGPDARDRARFAVFFTAVEHGKRAREAFLEAFGAEMPRLEQSFHRYLTEPQGSRRVAEYPPPPTAAPAVPRAMSDAEVHVLWARLMPRPDGSLDRVRRELDEALASDPESPEVRYRRGLFFLSSNRFDEADHEIAAALAARPDEPRYLLARLGWYEGRYKVGSDRIPMGLVEHLAHSATSAAQLRGAAGYMAQRGRADEGFRLIERALAVDPLSWQCQATRAEMLAGVGRFDEALAAVERARALLPEGQSVEVIVALRRKIELARGAANPAQGRTPP